MRRADKISLWAGLLMMLAIVVVFTYGHLP